MDKSGGCAVDFICGKMIVTMNSMIKNKKKISIVMLLVALGFVFCCNSAASSFLTDPGQMSGMNGHEDCAESSCLVSGEHRYMIVPSTVSFLGFVIVLFILFFILFSTVSGFARPSYVKIVRDRYGGGVVLNYLHSFFAKGILHPKVY